MCLCKAVNDRTIRAAIEEGARTVDDLAHACEAGTGCGGCAPHLEEMLDEAYARTSDRPSSA